MLSPIVVSYKIKILENSLKKVPCARSLISHFGRASFSCDILLFLGLVIKNIACLFSFHTTVTVWYFSFGL